MGFQSPIMPQYLFLSFFAPLSFEPHCTQSAVDNCSDVEVQTEEKLYYIEKYREE